MEQQARDAAPAQQGWSPTETIEQLRRHDETRDLVGAFEAVVDFSKSVSEHAGRVYLVGGAVRDELLNEAPHDLDLEVHGLNPEELAPLLAPFGVAEATGKSFATYKFRVGQSEIQIALPRTEVRTGNKHNAFDVTAHPEFGITEAARRRDFTIGAISKDVLTGEIFDPFHGIEDLDTKTLRMVDEKTFGEDPLRVLRGARFAARFGLTVEPATVEKMQAMVPEVGLLAKERLREEWTRMLTESKKPSIGIELLRDVGVIEHLHPEVAKLWQTEQDPSYHPEGNAGVHTEMVVDAAAELARSEQLDPQQRAELLFGSLSHDLGKPSTTVATNDHITALGHEAAGVKPAESFLRTIGIPETSITRIAKLVEYHMRPPALYRERDAITDRALRKLARDVGPSQLLSLVLLGEADHRGRGPFTSPLGEKKFPDTSGYHTWWVHHIERLSLADQPEPLISGRELIEGFGDRGWKQGKDIGEVLRLAEELRVIGKTRDEVREIIKASSTPSDAITELQTLLDTER